MHYQSIELLVEPVISVIVYNELLYVTFRAYVRHKYGIVNYHKFKEFFIEKGMDAFEEPLEEIHQLLGELNVRIIKDHQSVEELRDIINTGFYLLMHR